MKATFIIYKIERYTFKNEIVLETESSKEADEKLRQLNSSLNAESDHSYRLIVKQHHSNEKFNFKQNQKENAFRANNFTRYRYSVFPISINSIFNSKFIVMIINKIKAILTSKTLQVKPKPASKELISRMKNSKFIHTSNDSGNLIQNL